jgi:hypothetical protein
MIARTQLAVLDFNCGLNLEQAKRTDGTLRYKQCFSRVTQSWVVKAIKEKKERHYLEPLLKMTLEAVRDIKGLPKLSDIPKNIAPLEKPDKEEAIRTKLTRFKF